MDLGYLTELYNGAKIAKETFYPDNGLSPLEQTALYVVLVGIPLGILGNMLYKSGKILYQRKRANRE
mgnify:CR=1 FL=1